MNKKSNKFISLFAIIAWSILVLSFGYKPCNTVCTSEEQQNPNREEVVIEEEYVDPILLRSIELCKQEYTEEIALAAIAASKKYDIPIEVVYALIATESGKKGTKEINIHNIMNVNTAAKSNYNCIGVMQIHPKTALLEYNKYNNTNYTKDDLYDISVNIEIGTWHYAQFKTITTDWTELYVIYNVGYGRYNKINKNWFKDWDGKWKNKYKNIYFFMNDLYPPTDSKHSICKLKKYEAKKRFEVCYNLCKEYFNT